MTDLLPTEPLFRWSEVLIECISVAFSFATLGAVGLRVLVLPRAVAGLEASGRHALLAVRSVIETTAARLGLLGALCGVVATVSEIARTASEEDVGWGEVIARGGAPMALGLLFVPLILAGFAMAAMRPYPGWGLAVAGVLGYALRHAATGRWVLMVDPLHVLGGGLWIGTLFVLSLAALPPLLRAPRPEERACGVAAIVAAFSRLALCSAGLLFLTGIITTWRHVKYVAALWTTPYGCTLVAKLAVVALVFTVGAFNWRRLTPGLLEGRGAETMARAARAELLLAGVVLLISSVLVSLPTPKLPAPATAAPPPRTAQPAPAPPAEGKALIRMPPPYRKTAGN